MPKQLAKKRISLKQRQAFIKALTCFAMLSPEQTQELAKLMSEVLYSDDEKIVEEGALVDSVFIIARGHAEVTQLVIPKKKQLKLKLKKTPTPLTSIPLAILNSGDAVGLNDTGFFSTSGKRTANVTAISKVVALKLELTKLHEFLKKYPELKSAMYASSEQMLRTQFIKQSLAFSRLSQDRLMWLANQVEAASIHAGEIIFHEGEVGDRCYLIRKGKIEIITQNEDGTEHQLAVLKAPTLFGEATLITHSPRNATARAIEETELLELKHEYLSELIESEKNVASTFMTLMVDRSRPLKNPRVTAHERITADKQNVVILKNSDNGNYFKLSEEGWYTWEQMNGQQTMQEITMFLTDKYNIFAPDMVAALISKLAKTGFVTNIDLPNSAINANQPRWVRLMLSVRKVLEARIALGDADKWLTHIYQKVGYLLFSAIGKVFLALIIISGFIAFAQSTPYVIELFRTIHDSWILLIFLVPCTLLSVALHELGHALATKSYGREVHYMGVGWYWLGPIAFTDTSDMWLSSRRVARIFVNLAGVYTDLLVSGVCSLSIFVMPSAHLQAFLWLFALFTYISAFRMLNPLQELDGYYVLMDLFDRPRLRQSAVLWLVKEFPKAIRQPKLFRKKIPEISYWFACIIFMILISVLTLIVQTFVFKILGFQPSNPLVSLALPIIVGITSCLGIIADIRSQAED
ncbi:MAG: cyclic nucleotide-binding domain-containing protein [Gammaproteobacteria bacterium]